MIMTSFLKTVVSAGGAYTSATAFPFAINAGPWSDVDSVGAAGIRGTTAYLRVKPCTVLHFRMSVTADVKANMIRPSMWRPSIEFKLSTCSAGLASGDSTIPEAGTGKLRGPCVVSCTGLVNQPGLTSRATNSHARVTHRSATGTECPVVRRLRQASLTSWAT